MFLREGERAGRARAAREDARGDARRGCGASTHLDAREGVERHGVAARLPHGHRAQVFCRVAAHGNWVLGRGWEMSARGSSARPGGRGGMGGRGDALSLLSRRSFFLNSLACFSASFCDRLMWNLLPRGSVI